MTRILVISNVRVLMGTRVTKSDSVEARNIANEG